MGTLLSIDQAEAPPFGLTWGRVSELGRREDSRARGMPRHAVRPMCSPSTKVPAARTAWIGYRMTVVRRDGSACLRSSATQVVESVAVQQRS